MASKEECEKCSNDRCKCTTCQGTDESLRADCWCTWTEDEGCPGYEDPDH